MEDTLSRLEFKNTTVQLQAVDKLYQAVRKVAAGKPLSSSSLETAECQLLWQCTGSVDQFVALQSSSRWLQLVQDGCAEFTYILNGFLNQIPIAKSMLGIVHGLGELMVLQVLLKISAGVQVSCPYKIRNPPHPFITMVTNRPSESWMLIVEFVGRLFSYNNGRIGKSVFVMLDPFLKFVLLDPKRASEYSNLRWSLQQALLKGVTQQVGEESRAGMQYLIDSLCQMQMKTSDDLTETSRLCTGLLHLYNSKVTDFDLYQGQKLCAVSLTLTSRCQSHGLDYFTLLQALQTTCQQCPQILCRDEHCGILAEVLLRASPDDCVVLLLLAKSILKSNDAGEANRCTEGFLYLPLINILALPSNVAVTPTHKMMTSLASELLVLIEQRKQYSRLVCDGLESEASLPGMEHPSSAWVKLAGQFSKQSALDWLSRLAEQLSHMCDVPGGLVHLLVWLLLTSTDPSLGMLAIDRLAEVAIMDHCQTLYILPVYLYAIARKHCPTLRHHILLAIPKLGTNKYNVPPVLKTIQGLGQSPKLKSISIRLLTDLWSLQDRCFPHLLKVVTEKGHGQMSMATLVDEVTLAKANAIRTVCQKRPEQHGADMLGPISDLLNMCTDTLSAPVAALALEALYFICEAEVIDIVSTWKVLESLLLRETRSVVVEKICQLLSLVPRLAVRTEEYQVFLEETTCRLWLYTRTDDQRVITAACKSLAHFSRETFKASQMNFQLIEDFVAQAKSCLEEGASQDVPMDTLVPSVPGVCYVRLLQQMSGMPLKGFKDLMAAMTAEEVSNLPRGIYYTSLRRPGASTNQNKAIAGIPVTIQTLYEKSKQIGLRPSLAAALLFCYDPPVEVGRDGRPRKHYSMSHGKQFQQMFTLLLQDVQAQPSNWQQTTTLPGAWAAFMERLFASMMQARKTEIEAQLRRDFIDTKESQEKTTAAWLWVRDTVTDVIKKSTRGSPTVQFNAILALTGLAQAVQRFATSLSKEEMAAANQITEHISHSHWLMLLLDSLMSLVDFTFKPKAGLMGFCQQRSADDRLPASVLAQAAAVLALCHLTSITMATYNELTFTVLEHLQIRLPGRQEDSDLQPILHLVHGFGLGVMLANLVAENFPDVAGTRGAMAVLKAQDALETCCVSSSEYRTGPLLGLRESLAALCLDGKTESRVHVVAMLRRLQGLLATVSPSRTEFQPLCVCLGGGTSVAFLTNAVDLEMADTVRGTLYKLMKENTENQSLALVVGSLCYSLKMGGSATIGQLKSTLQSDWLDCVRCGGNSTLGKVASLHGLFASIGLEKDLLKVDSLTSEGNIQSDPVVKCALDLVTQSDGTLPGDLVGIQATTVWLLGQFFMASSSAPSSTNTVPGNFSYLPESSILRAVVDFLISAGKLGPENVQTEHVEVCLKSIQEKITGVLPPLNWMAVLSPLMKLPYGDETKKLCLQLALNVCTNSTSAALFLSSWITVPLFNTLPGDCQVLLLASAGCYVKNITPAVLQTFLEKTCLPAVGLEQGKSLCKAALKGLNAALCVPDPPESVAAMLYRSVCEAFKTLKMEKDPSVQNSLAECMSHVPDKILHQLTSGDCQCADSLLRGTQVRCYLVSHGCQPIALLNSCIDAAFNLDCERDHCLHLLLHCFYMMSLQEKAKSRPLERCNWLLELMGHCYNLATGTYTINHSNKSKVVKFAISLMAGAVSLWTDKSAAAKLGLSPCLLQTSDLSEVTVAKGQGHVAPGVTLAPLEALADCVGLLQREPWVQILSKVLDWLINMLGVDEGILHGLDKMALLECLIGLRHCSDYTKITVWTRAVQSVYS
ncbi:focadhesin-like isoform X6 [Dreissena polymorpha]|uniref:focadhesin-like isoform X3 n=1 Tax=Dreissena polymorpha TaxID=45954 RepID=UPI0022650746|nr:focadhesin-like isoform X3 [Dreissena polymorpha]XP_052281894.1 focadhesin-like isoform X4 [Dreissena polymorpha]XP_052281895.1 focadhesin-like isoform X5 [Dreissena polymorpha]XP_052281896.1 focadhesin-like isoform X6 [Dreissena polymorpha]